MGQQIHDYLIDKSGVVALDSAADVLVITPVAPMEIIMFGFMVTIVLTGTGLDLSLDKRVTAGTDTGRVEQDVLDANLAVAVAKGMFLQLASPLKLIPGEQAVIEVKVAATAGDGVVWAMTKPLPLQPIVVVDAVGVGDMINYTRKA